MTTVATTEITNDNGKIGEGSSDMKEKVDNETSFDIEKREAQVALMTLRSNYARTLKLKERVWKLVLFLISLSLLCMIIGSVLIFLKEHIVNLNSVVSLSVSAGGFLISGGGVIAAFRSLLTSNSNSHSGIEKGDKIPDIDLAESSILIVQSKLIDKVYNMIKELKEKSQGLISLEMVECFWLFAGCVFLFGIAGYEFLNFATRNSNGIVLDIALIIIGLVGLAFCLSVGLVLQFAKQRFSKKHQKSLLFYFICPFVWFFSLISISEEYELDLKDIRFPRTEEEKVLYLLYGIMYNDNAINPYHDN
ncbi:24180_t:CDS:1 [Dentiscutata erythropus]|uniref:24180_t:CDS:1 n=1 Tax=Dentiscutata erythropus TaxID=1348616 RepID=A0A9N8W1Q9_9GLOM|nr:24180_t:CDS:1 [Dentiscutata erythropus]